VTDRDLGEVICSACGLVIRDTLITQRPEWRAFTPEEKASKIRVGAPISFQKFDKGLSTTFQPFVDIYGKPLPIRQRLKMMRLRKWNIRARIHSSADRNLSQAMNELMRLLDKLQIPKDVGESAALIYRRALEKKLVRGRSIHGITAASLYAACRLTKTPRSLKEIVNASTRSRKEISRNYRLIQQELILTTPIDDPSKFVSKIASKVRLSQVTENRAIQLLQEASRIRAIVGKAPAGLAAAALYIASLIKGEKTTQRDLAKAADVTEVTVRNRYKRLVRDLNLKV